jgi:hypothetical protein
MIGEELGARSQAKDDSWLSSARAYFMALGPNERWDEAAVDARVGAAVEDGATVLMCFVQDEGYAMWPTSLVPVSPRAAGIDILELLAQRTRAAGLRFVAQWMGVHVQTVLAERHPSWLQRDRAGVAAAAMCLNSPFGGSLLRQIGEVVGRYDVDGVYFDGLYARFGGCFCPYCALQFKAIHGRSLDGEEGAPGTTRAGSHWLDFSTAEGAADADLTAFRFATVEGFVRRVRSTIDAARPGVALLLDTLGVQAAHWANAQRLARLGEDVDAFVLECYPDQIREPLWHAALETELCRAEGRKPVWLLRWLARDPDGDLVAVPEATVELFAGTAIAHGTPPVAVEMNLHSVDASLRPVVRRTFGDAAEAGQGDPVAYAGILHSASTRDAVLAAGRERDLYDPLAGAYLALLEEHLPTRIVTESDIAEGRLPAGLRTIVVPGSTLLSAATVSGLAAWVAAGGGLVATHRAGFGTEVDTTTLAELFGIRTAGVGARDGRIGTESLGGRELITYYRPLGDHAAIAGFGGRLLSFSGSYTRVTEHDGIGLGAILDTDDAAMDGERWFGWYPGAASSQLGVAREVNGGGRVVYFAAPLDVVFFRQGRPEAGEIIAAATRWAAGSPPIVEVEGPRSVEAVVRQRQGGSWEVVLVNRATNDLYAIGAAESLGAASSSASGASSGQRTIRAQHPRYVVPVGPITVKVALGGGSPASARSLRIGELEISTTDSGASVTLPSLGPYDVVTIG